jgi:hypothetical protein
VTRVITGYQYTCNGCGKETRTGGDDYPERWTPADPENCDDDGEDYCPACDVPEQP